MKIQQRRLIINVCLLLGLVITGSVYAELPVPEPPFKTKKLSRQNFKLSLEKNISDSSGKIGDRAVFQSGHKRFCFNTHKNAPSFGKSGIFSVYLDEISKRFPAMRIHLAGWVPGVGAGGPFKGINDSQGVITADKNTQTVTFTKNYYYSKDKTAEFVCKVMNADKGVLKIEWHSGLTEEQIQQLPKGSSFSLTFEALWNKHKEFGIECNGKNLSFTPANELKQGKQPKDWCYKTLLNTQGATLTFYDKKPRNTIKLNIGKEWNVKLYEAMWYNPKPEKENAITFNAKATQPLGKGGSVTIDLGETAVKGDNTPPLIADIDFYARDRMHVPKLPTKNMLPNPSFEQDLRYLRWYWGGGGGQLSPIPTYTTSNDAKFGKKSLMIQPSPRGDYFLSSFPIPIVPGETYTLSFYAKSTKPGEAVKVIVKSPLTNYASKLTWGNQPPYYKLTPEWSRHSFTFKADTRAIVLLISKYCKGPVYLDGFQLEKGDMPTAFAAPIVEGILKTSDPDNMIDRNAPINASFQLTGQPKTDGDVRVRVKDYYDKVIFDKSYNFKLDDNGNAGINLPFDHEHFGEGVFVVRADYNLKGKSYYTDYYRYSKMKFLENTHASKNMFNNQFIPRLTRREALARNYKRWGIGSACAVTHDRFIDVKHQLCEQNNIDFSFGVVFDMGHHMKEFSDNSYSVMRRNPWGRKVEPWTEITPEREKWIEETTYEIVKKHPKITTWAPMGETACRLRELYKGDFSYWKKMAKAFYKGAKRANPNVKLLPCQGPAGFVPELDRGIEEVRGVMKSVQGEIKWDAIAVHPYFSTDGVNGASDLDKNITYLMNLMKKYGYDDTPIWFPEGGNFTSMYVPEWNCKGCQDQYGAGRASYDSSWYEYVQAFLHARRFIISFKYWPRVHHLNMWTSKPFVDYYLTPLYMCKVVNTLGQLFENPKYVADIKPMKSIRGYAFRDHKDRGLVAIWATEDKVDRGQEVGAELLVTFPGKLPEFIDLMGNKRDVKSDNGTVKILLSSAPLFVRGEPGKVEEIVNAFKNATIIGTRNVMSLSVLPNEKGAVDACITNNVARELSGTISDGELIKKFNIPANQKTIIPLTQNQNVDFGVMYDWSKSIEVALNNSDAFVRDLALEYFYIPRVEKALPLNPDATEWNTIPAYKIDNWRALNNVKYGHEGDMSASYQLAWNQDALYLRVDIKDDDYGKTNEFNDSCLYQFDNCIEVYFDTGANARASGREKGYDQDDYRYDFAAIADDGNKVAGRAAVYRLREAYHQLAGGIVMPSKKDVAQELQSQFKRTENGCAYVIKFDQKYLEPLMLRKGSVAGFGLFIHDKESGEQWPKKGLSSSCKKGQHCDYYPQYWPIMVLGD